jgi:hypothetical protein
MMTSTGTVSNLFAVDGYLHCVYRPDRKRIRQATWRPGRDGLGWLLAFRAQNGAEIEVTPRIGIRHCADWPLRYVIKSNPFVGR